MAASDRIPIPYLRECLDYEPATGLVRWRERPRNHFMNDAKWRAWNGSWPGCVAGYSMKLGYRLISITINGQKHHILAHRAAWALTYGEYPPLHIDHWDGDPANNRINNLKAVTVSQNHQNRGSVTGVYFDPHRLRWQAKIQIDNRTVHLGNHSTEEAAHQAYLDGKKKYHRYRPIPRA
jgi:hypothetical protein